MKKVIEDKKSETAHYMTYEEASKQLWSVFNIPQMDCKFTDNCVCGLTADIEDGQIKSFTISYDKIGFEIEGFMKFWPIQKYTRTVPLEEGNELLEHLRK